MSETALGALPPVGLYVHYPFCKRKCPYCDFNSYPKAQFQQSAGDELYTSTLTAEFKAQQELRQARGDTRRFISLFLGGGTPSLWPLSLLERFLTELEQAGALAPAAELSIEVNPGTAADVSYFKELLNFGINRLSVGVQSFNDQSLRALGRIHDAAQARRSLDAAAEAGFTRVNLDIMHGLPGQHAEQALYDLREAARWATHLSWYELTLEEDSYFGAHPPVLPSEDDLAEIEEQGFALLRELGFTRYEISGFTKERRCVHNENYWRFGDYLGLGAGAHSKLTVIDGSGRPYVLRRADEERPDRYLQSFNAPWQQVAAADLPFEYMLNRLRLFEPIPCAEFARLTGLSFAACALPKLKQGQEEGLVTFSKDGACYELTPKGRVMLNALLELFLD